jgi:hypothetical protein
VICCHHVRKQSRALHKTAQLHVRRSTAKKSRCQSNSSHVEYFEGHKAVESACNAARLMQDRTEAIKRIAAHLDIDLTDELLSTALQQSDKEEMYRNKSKYDEHPLKLRLNEGAGLDKHSGLGPNATVRAHSQCASCRELQLTVLVPMGHRLARAHCAACVRGTVQQQRALSNTRKAVNDLHVSRQALELQCPLCEARQRGHTVIVCPLLRGPTAWSHCDYVSTSERPDSVVTL